MEILRRIDKGYRLIEKARFKSEKIMNENSIKTLKDELDLLLDEGNEIRVNLDEVRNRLSEKENQLLKLNKELSLALGKLYESEQQNSKILIELKRQETILKEKKIDIEEEMLKEFHVIEKLSKNLNAFKSKYNKKEKLYNSKRVAQHEKLVYMEDKIKSMEKKLRKLRKSVNPELLKIYDKKRRTLKIVCASVEDGVCEICKNLLDISTIEKVKTASELAECEHCSRILYLEEVKDNDETL